MSEKPEQKSNSAEQLSKMTPRASQLGRRLFILRAAAVLGGAVAASVGKSKTAQAKDFGSGHQDPEGQHHVYDVGGHQKHKHKHKHGNSCATPG